MKKKILMIAWLAASLVPIFGQEPQAQTEKETWVKLGVGADLFFVVNIPSMGGGINLHAAPAPKMRIHTSLTCNWNAGGYTSVNFSLSTLFKLDRSPKSDILLGPAVSVVTGLSGDPDSPLILPALQLKFVSESSKDKKTGVRFQLSLNGLILALKDIGFAPVLGIHLTFFRRL